MPHFWHEYLVLARIEQKLDRLHLRLDSIHGRLDSMFQLAQQEEKQMSALDDQITALQQDVANEQSVSQSAITLINGIAQQVQDAVAAALAAGASQDQLQSMTDLSTAIQTQSGQLAQAVTANTPTPPTPPSPNPVDPNAPPASGARGPARTGPGSTR